MMDGSGTGVRRRRKRKKKGGWRGHRGPCRNRKERRVMYMTDTTHTADILALPSKHSTEHRGYWSYLKDLGKIGCYLFFFSHFFWGLLFFIPLRTANAHTRARLVSTCLPQPSSSSRADCSFPLSYPSL